MFKVANQTQREVHPYRFGSHAVLSEGRGQKGAGLWRRLAISSENGQGLFTQVSAQGCCISSFSLYGVMAH